MHEGLWQQLIGLNPQATAARAKCEFLSDPDRYVLGLVSDRYEVRLAERSIVALESTGRLASRVYLTQLCLLAYLINAQDLPLAGKLVRPEMLPTGQFFFRGLHRPPTETLEKAFGPCPDRLLEAVGRLGATQCEYGDASIELLVLPRVPITFAVWRADDEFPARASVLVDQTVAAHLPLDALHVAMDLAVDAVVEACQDSK